MGRAPAWAMAAWCLAAVVVSAQLPQPTGRINDFADILTAAEEQELAALVADVERETTAQVAVATVRSLNGTTVEDYAVQLFEAWGIGRRDIDNGVLILVAPNEREMRIEVGYGLESILPDGLAGAIIREAFLPRFRENDYGGGIVAGTRRVAEVVRRNHVLTAEERAALDRQAGETDGAAWILVPFLSIFEIVGFGMLGAGVAALAIGPILLGAFFGGVPMLLGVLVMPGWGARILMAVAALAVVGGVRYGLRPANRASLRRSSRGQSSGWVWGNTGSGGSGSSGGSDSSGGFGGGSWAAAAPAAAGELRPRPNPEVAHHPHVLVLEDVAVVQAQPRMP
ncbi:MAG: TPM domain-containing protein [Vicinamibacterales bacterium]